MNDKYLIGGRELFEGEESVLRPIGELTRAIEAMSFHDFIVLMVELSKRNEMVSD